MSVRREFQGAEGVVRVVCRHVRGDRYAVQVGDASHEVEARALPDGRVALVLDGRNVVASTAPCGDGVQVRLDGSTWHLPLARGRRGAAAAAGTGVVEAPMTGTVLDVLVAVGDEVEPGTKVAVLSAMKMEHKLVADVRGTVAEVLVEAGANVDQGALVVRITPADAGG